MAELPSKIVLFPHDLPQWPRIRAVLQDLSEPSSDLDESFDRLCQLWAAKKSSKKPTFLLHNTPYAGLRKFIHGHAEPEAVDVFLNKSLPTIAAMVLQGENLLKTEERLRYSLQQNKSSVVLKRQLVACIVATAFLSLFPGCLDENDEEKNDLMPNANCHYLFENMFGSQRAKIQCFLHYFERLAEIKDGIEGEVTFRRIVVQKEELLTADQLATSDKSLCAFVVPDKGVIEDAGSRVLQVDFANEYLGGGVLYEGNVQEEIRFSICPELVASMLFMECMAPNEAVIISGFEQFSRYQGYGGSLSYDGDCSDPSERDEAGNILTTLCAIDAVPLCSTKTQFEQAHYMRDINKAYIGFLQPYVTDRSFPDDVSQDSSEVFKLNPDKVRAIASGNWGCGVFGGNPQLKALLQWISASAAGCPALIYYKFDNELVKDLSEVTASIAKAKWTVGEFFQIIIKMCEEELGKPATVPFDFIRQKLAESVSESQREAVSD